MKMILFRRFLFFRPAVGSVDMRDGDGRLNTWTVRQSLGAGEIGPRLNAREARDRGGRRCSPSAVPYPQENFAGAGAEQSHAQPVEGARRLERGVLCLGGRIMRRAARALSGRSEGVKAVLLVVIGGGLGTAFALGGVLVVEALGRLLEVFR